MLQTQLQKKCLFRTVIIFIYWFTFSLTFIPRYREIRLITYVEDNVAALSRALSNGQPDARKTKECDCGQKNKRSGFLKLKALPTAFNTHQSVKK